MKKLIMLICFSVILVLSSGFAATCMFNGTEYQDGQQREVITGCIDSMDYKQCADNYQYTTCSNGVWQGMGPCYPSKACRVPGVAVVLPGVDTNKFSSFLLFAAIMIIVGVVAIVYLSYWKPLRGKKRKK